MFEAHVERQKQEHNQNAWLAWHVAALSRTDPKKFPKLEKLLYREPPKPQTPEQMEAVLRQITITLGGSDMTKG